MLVFTYVFREFFGWFVGLLSFFILGAPGKTDTTQGIAGRVPSWALMEYYEDLLH